MNTGHTMQTAVQRYLEERRRLGFALKSPSTELMRFARFADGRGHQGPLTLELQLDWAREHVAQTSPVTAARRLEIVRPFAAHHRQFEPATEVPPPFILGRGHRRLAPHIYTNQVRISANVTDDFGIVTGPESVLGCVGKIVGMRSC